MKTQASKRIVTIAAVTLIALSSVPARGGNDGSTCGDGLNVTGVDCHPDNTPGATNLKRVSPAINYLKNSNDCNGILSRPDELTFLKQVDSINANFMEGKISLADRGQQIQSAAQKTTKGNSDPRATALLVGEAFDSSERAKETYANIMYLQQQHGIKPTPDQYKVLERMGVPAKDADKFVQESSKHLQPGIQSMIDAGMKLQKDGNWDMSQMSGKFTPSSIDPTLKTSVGYFVGTGQAAEMTNPNRSTVLLTNTQAMLPGLADAQGKHTGKVQVMNLADYKALVSQKITEFQDAAKEAESASAASNGSINLFEQKFGKNTTEKQEKAQALAKMNKAIDDLKALGLPAGSKDAPMTQVLSIASSLTANDAAAYKAGMANVDRTIKIAKITATGAAFGAALAGVSKIADLADLGEEYNAIKIAKGSRAAAEAIKDASLATKAGSFLRSVNTYWDVKNMVNMAAMPFMFSGGSSAINALIDSSMHGGSFSCRFANEMTGKLGDNLLMANFAWVTPAANMVGGLTEIASAGKVAAGTVSGVINTAQAVGFAGQMALSVGPEGQKTYKQGIETWHAIEDARQGGDKEMAKAQTSEFLKDLASTGVDATFAVTGLKHIGTDILHSAANADGAEGSVAHDVGTAARNQLSIQDRVKTGEYKAGDVIKENGVKGSYTVVDTADTNVDPTTGKKFIIAMADNAGNADHGKLYKIYPDDINAHLGDSRLGTAVANAKVNLSGEPMSIFNNPYEKEQALIANGTKLDTGTSTIRYNAKDAAKIAEGQAKVRSLQGEEAPAPDTAAKTDDVATNDGVPKFESIEDIVKNDPNSPIVQVRNRVVDSLKKITDKTWGKYKSALNDNSIIERAVNSLNKEELTKLDKKIEVKPEEVKKEMAEIGENCGLDGHPVAGSWDPEGYFKGILYAQNDASCEKL